MNPPEPLRGEVWDLDLDTFIGREQAGFRPALVLSVDLFNVGPAELVVAVPITRTQRGFAGTFQYGRPKAAWRLKVLSSARMFGPCRSEG